jgi:hypothetical protein
LYRAAQAELIPALLEDGATAESAERAAAEITWATLFFGSELRRGVDPDGELARLAEVLREAQWQIEMLSPDALIALRVALKPGPRPPRLFGAGGMRNVLTDTSQMLPREAFDAIERALPYVNGNLTVRAKKMGRTPDHKLQNLIHRTAKLWLDASTKWPSATSEGGMAKAPLYAYIARYSGAHVTSSMWSRALSKVKELEGGPLLAKANVRRKPRP